MLKDDLLALALALSLIQQLVTAPAQDVPAPPVKPPPKTAPETQKPPPKTTPEPKEPQVPSFYTEEKVGSGPAAVEGQVATVHILAEDMDGKEIINTRKRGLPFRFQLGKAEPGLSPIVLGMKAGGVRLAVIPKDQIRAGKGLPPLIPVDSAIQIRVWLVTSTSVKAGR